jgi:hypothetical protein
MKKLGVRKKIIIDRPGQILFKVIASDFDFVFGYRLGRA